MIALRSYQEDAVEGIRQAFVASRRVLLVSPTGSGKTVTFSYIGQRVAERGKRVTFTAHREQIVRQISKSLDEFGVRHGVIARGRTMTDDLVQVAMVQTLARRLDRVQEPALLVVDEAHHGVAGTWKNIAGAWVNARQLGVTATPQRLDGRGLGTAFDAMVMGPQTADLIADGYLAPFDYMAPPALADLSSVRSRAGDYAVDDLAKVMDRQFITGNAVSHYRKHLGGRPAVAFCVDIEHARHVADEFRIAGYRSESVDGKLDPHEVRRRIAALSTGDLNVLTSCELISEGVDVPTVAGVIMLRPTKSLAMFLQMCGRCLRLKPDGSSAVILDHVGNVKRHGMPDERREWSLTAKKKKPVEPSITTCEQCFRVLPSISARSTAKAECLEAACPLKEAPLKVRKELEEVEGELVRIDPEELALLQTADLSELLKGATTFDQVDAIRRARKYHPGWTRHVMRNRRTETVDA